MASKKFIVLSFFLFSFIALPFFQLPILASEPTGGINAIEDDDVMRGWAQKSDDPSYFVPVKIYADLPIANLTPSPTNFVDSTIADKAGWTVNHNIEYKIPARFKDGKPHFFYAFITLSNGQQQLLSPGYIMYPNKINSAYYLSPNYPSNQGWTADDTNYFAKWSCSSTTGIDTIRRLNIIPLGTHHPSFWKDSTWINNLDYQNNLPIVYFTGSMRLWGAKFNLKKAAFNANQNKWEIIDVMDPKNPGLVGVSSQDGYGDDYVLNEYDIAAWGPTANKPGSQSKIPGVADSHTPPGHAFPRAPITYPLYGTGPLGITTITQYKQSDTPNPFGIGYNTCIHMNPTLFDYDQNGIPHSLAVWLTNLGDGDTPCKLPSGESLPNSGTYVYHFINSSVGWQLDRTIGSIPGGSSANYSFGSNQKILGTIDGKSVIASNLSTKPITTNKILDCSQNPTNFFLGEIAGTEQNLVFVASLDPYGGPAVGLTQVVEEKVLMHDIYYAYSSTTNPAQGAIDGITATGVVHGWAIDKDVGQTNAHFYIDGEAGSGGIFLGSSPTGISRPDLLSGFGYGAKGGFQFQIPDQYLKDGKNHRLYGYSIGTNLIKVNESNTPMQNNGIIIPSTVSTNPGDLNADGHVNLFDFNLLVSKFGNPYTIFDFNAIVSNYGK